MSLRLKIVTLRALLSEAEQSGFKSSPGPDGQSCCSCEFGERFDDEDKDTDGWCRLWDISVSAKSWCESWSKSDRLKHVKPKDSDQSPDRETRTPSQKRAAKAKAQEPKKVAPAPGGGKLSAKVASALAAKRKPPAQPTSEPDEGEDEEKAEKNKKAST